MNTYQYWQKIEGVIDKALALEEELREGYIRKTCGHNPAMLDEALDYYSFIKRANETKFLESGSQKYSDLLLDSENEIEQNVIGTKIGPYQITTLIGEGGMGAVYLAKRIDGEFSQKVAIKFLRGGYFSSYMRKRFKNEKKILSKLNHPNITRLLDGGITDDGTPYLTMEYVDGLPLDEFCNTNKLGVKDRLNIFLQLCEAVQFAHSKLIIHRDLKPQNIFVTTEGQVKIMDFGIAKFLNPDLEGEGTLQTRQGQIIASFNYAAPEQFRSEEKTIAVDVYGLGALLYLLLTGQPPHQFEDSSISEIESIIREKAPVSPGQLSSNKFGPISSDLEAVIMKALRKEVSERYSSVQNFSDDIHRYLNQKPVHAKDRSTAYKIKKYIARNKAPIGTAVLVLFTIIGFLLYHVNAMNQQVERAEHEAERAEVVKSFLVNMFSEANPYISPGEPITVRALLDQNTEEIISKFADQPDIALELLDVIGTAQMDLANRQQARVTLEKGFKMIESGTVELDPPDLASYKLKLAAIYSGVSERRTELLVQAKSLIKDHPDELLLQSEIERGLAYSAFAEGDFDHSVELIRDAINIACETDIFKENPDYCIRILGDAYYFLDAGGKHDEAFEAAEQSYKITMDYFEDSDHQRKAVSGQLYAEALVNHHRPNEAIDVIHQSQETVKIYDGEDNMRLVYLAFPLAFAESARGNDQKAIEHWRWALTRLMEEDPDGLGRPVQLNHMVERLLNLKRFEEARHAYEEFAFEDPEHIPFHAIWKERYNEFRMKYLTSPPGDISMQDWLNVLETFQENYDALVPMLKMNAIDYTLTYSDLEAAQYWYDKLNTLENFDPKANHTSLLTFARYWLAENNIEKAEKTLDRARALFEEREEHQGPRIAKLNAIQAEILCRSGDDPSGEVLLRQAEQEWILAEGHPDGLLTLQAYAASCSGRDRK